MSGVGGVGLGGVKLMVTKVAVLAKVHMLSCISECMTKGNRGYKNTYLDTLCGTIAVGGNTSYITSELKYQTMIPQV